MFSTYTPCQRRWTVRHRKIRRQRSKHILRSLWCLRCLRRCDHSTLWRIPARHGNTLNPCGFICLGIINTRRPSLRTSVTLWPLTRTFDFGFSARHTRPERSFSLDADDRFHGCARPFHRRSNLTILHAVQLESFAVETAAWSFVAFDLSHFQHLRRSDGHQSLPCVRDKWYKLHHRYLSTAFNDVSEPTIHRPSARLLSGLVQWRATIWGRHICCYG
jgi:hypothetical protein